MTEQPIDATASVTPEPSAGFGRQLSREVVLYTVGTVAANGILYFSVPIYTRIFEPAVYSQFAFVTTTIAFLSGAVFLGGDTTLARFWFQEEDAHARRRLTTTWIAFLGVVAVTVCLLLLPLTGAAAAYTLDDSGRWVLFALALALLPIQQTSRLTAQVLRNEFRPVAFVVTSVALGILSLGCGLLFVAAGFGIAGILLGLLCAEAGVLLVRIAQMRDMLTGPIELPRLRPLLKYGAPLVPVTLTYWIFTSADRVVVGKVAGLRDLGVYSVAVTVTMVFVVLSQALATAWLPRVIQLYERDRAQAAVVVSKVLTYYVFGLGLLAVSFSAFAPEITAVLAGPSYAAAASAIPLLCLGAVANGSQSVTASGLTLTHRTGRLAVISLITAVINVVAAIVLVRAAGIVGAAAASLIGYGLVTAGFLWASQRAWPIRLEVRRLAVLIFLLAATTTVTTAAMDDLPFGVRIALPVVYVAAALIAGPMSQTERSALHRLVARRG